MHCASQAHLSFVLRGRRISSFWLGLVSLHSTIPPSYVSEWQPNHNPLSAMMVRLLVATVLAASVGLSAASLSCVGDDGTMRALGAVDHGGTVTLFVLHSAIRERASRTSATRISPCAELACDHMLFYFLHCCSAGLCAWWWLGGGRSRERGGGVGEGRRWQGRICEGCCLHPCTQIPQRICELLVSPLTPSPMTVQDHPWTGSSS